MAARQVVVSSGQPRVAPEAGREPADLEILRRVEAVVLLAGSIRPFPLSLETGRSVLDLPVTDGRAVLGMWVKEHKKLAGVLDRHVALRLLLDRKARVPSCLGTLDSSRLRVERDPSEYRGTGGLLRDLAVDYPDDAYLLVASAAQLLLESVVPVVFEMARLGGDVCLLSHADGSPACMILVRCGSLRRISPVGYIDFKEQALPEIAKRFTVRVLQRERPVGIPVRTRAEYVAALTAYHRRHAAAAEARSPFAEEWKPRFAIVEKGADVAEGAIVQDSVVLRGARVESGATVTRSIVCGGEVRRPLRPRRVLGRLGGLLGL